MRISSGAFPFAGKGPRKIDSLLRVLHKPLLHTLLAATVLLVGACNSTKWVPPGERLLVKNTVTIPSGTLDADELQSIIKQKPNKRVLGRPMYLYLYNLRNPEKVARKRALKDSLCAVENDKRKLLGKDPRTCDRSSRGRSGEAPVILDSNLLARTSQQFALYAFKEGFFEVQVSDTVHLDRPKWPFGGWSGRPFKKPKAAVEYRITPGRPWVYCVVDYHVDDPLMAAIVQEEWDQCMVKPGERFDDDLIEAERTRITDLLRRRGYLWFTRDMVLFDADTSAGDHEVDMRMSLERPLNIGQRGLRGTPEGTPYYLENVVIDATRRTKANAGAVPDTLRYNGYTFLYLGRRPEFRPKALLGPVFLRPGYQFNQLDADRTFRRLTNLRVFDRVEITYDTAGVGRKGYANCRIGLLPSKRQGFSIEGFGTNRGGFLGTSVNFNYRHKNLFRTMASIQASLTLGLEAQQSLSTNSASEDASTAIGRDALFNTVEIGPEVKVGFPMRIGSARSGGGRFVINTLYNYQRRPDYTRTLVKGAIGVEVNSTATQVVGFYLPEVNVIRIPRRSNSFIDFLENTNDPVLSDSYTDHLIINIPRVTYTLNTAAEKKQRNSIFDRINFEWAGTVLRWIQGGNNLRTESSSGERYHTLFDVRYAEYLKLENDLRFYHTIHDRSSLAFRLALGVAKPFGNQTVMPFETSFFSGGANGMRAWRARSLGPGSYNSITNSFDRIGEARIEGNIEYRFKVFGYLEGALFSDFGNIWLLQDNPAKPGSQFKGDSFISEIAVGTGLGARLNFDFFLVRFDLGVQTKDPSLPAGQRWIYESKDPGLETRFGQKLNFNLGIGYPF